MASEKEQAKGAAAARPAANLMVASTVARAHLECAAGPEKGQTFRIAPNVTVVGRDATCDLVLSETAISRQHFRIDRRGDQWFLKNLSSNGTTVGKKPADEVVLADGDEIRIGAKTRLKFVIETVAISSTGRPQFRARTGAAIEDAEKSEEEAAEGEGQSSVFQRRKKLFIALGAYLGVILIGLAIGTWWKFFGGGKAVVYQVPVLALEDQVRPAGGARPYKILSIDAAGIYCEDELGQHVLVPNEDLKTGRAALVPGIGKSLDVKFAIRKDTWAGNPYAIDEVNPAMAEQCVKQAGEEYRVRYLPGKEGSLFSCVRLLQRALAYYSAGGFFKDPQVDKMYHDALRELLDAVKRDYDNAVIYDRADSYQKSWEMYRHIQRLVPERDNPIFDNVVKRMNDLKRRHPDLK